MPAIYLDNNGLVRTSLFWHNSVSQQMVFNSPYDNGRWHFIADTYNNGIESLYLDGVFVGSQSVIESSYSSVYYYFIGAGTTSSWPYIGSGVTYFHGSMADVQVYNTSLSADRIQYLYKEGIGGAPIDLQNLVGWWSLNGDANDYSGNDNNGVPSNVSYTGSWTNGYTVP